MDITIGQDLKNDFETLKTSKMTNFSPIGSRLSIYCDYLACGTLWVRPIFPSDNVYLRDVFTDPMQMQYWGAGHTYTLQEIEGITYKYAKKNLSKQSTSAWSVITHEGLAGCFLVHETECETKREIAYISRPAFAGRGLTTTAGNLILSSELFTPPHFKGIVYATVHPNNKASRRVLEKLGLEPDPDRQGVQKYNSVRNYWQRDMAKKSIEIEEENHSVPILHDFYKSMQTKIQCLPQPSSRLIPPDSA